MARRALTLTMAVASISCSLLVDPSGLSDVSREAGDADVSLDGDALPDSEAGSTSVDGAVLPTDSALADVSVLPNDAAEAGGSAYAAAVLADQPIMYLRFGDPAGTIAPRDETGNVQVSAIGAPVFGRPGAIAGDPDTAVLVELSGFDCGSGFDFIDQEPFSIELWAKIPSDVAPSDTRFLVRKGDFFTDGAAPPEAYSLYFTADSFATNVVFSWRNGGTTYAANPIIVPNLEFRHIVAVFTGAQIQVWYDGFAREVASTSGFAANKQGKFYVGLRDAMTGFARTEIDELAVYESALSDVRIKAHFAIGKATSDQ